MKFISLTKGGINVNLHVLPNAPKSQIIGPHGESLKIKINAPPIDGKANQEIVRFFSELLDVAKTSMEVVKGGKSKTKVLFIRNISRETFLAKVMHE